jgi:hypothetical protein
MHLLRGPGNHSNLFYRKSPEETLSCLEIAGNIYFARLEKGKKEIQLRRPSTSKRQHAAENWWEFTSTPYTPSWRGCKT